MSDNDYTSLELILGTEKGTFEHILHLFFVDIFYHQKFWQSTTAKILVDFVPHACRALSPWKFALEDPPICSDRKRCADNFVSNFFV